MIVGTAGHIDHGKTALIRALTGVDTDRLKEEQARGMTIELGYAYQNLPNGEVLGFIDVPGHERFVHTMLAGAAGIDFALLVVAVDDGIMPQTREHLDILDQLGIRQGAVVLSKIDRAESHRIAEVEQEVHLLMVHSSGLAQAPCFAVSALTGKGIEPLRVHIQSQAMIQTRLAEDRRFRLAVDRSFTLKGIGTVVTGTVFAGEVRVGDELVVTPSGMPVRLRNLHVMNQPATDGRAGQRCALNVVSAAKDDIRRGDWLVAPSLHAPTDRFDALLTVSRHAGQPVKHWAAIHLHLGAAHVMGRVALLENESLSPGESALTQLVLDRPVVALRGDAFIVRDADAKHTLGGGRVLDPWAPQRKRRTAERLVTLAALQIDEPQTRLARLLDHAEWGLDLDRLARGWNLPALARLLPKDAKVVAGAEQTLAFAPARWQMLEQRLQNGLMDFHARFPDERGPEASRARRMYLAELPAQAFSALIEDMLATSTIWREGAWLYLPDHRVTLNQHENALYERVRPWLTESAFDPPWVRELAKRAGVEEGRMRQLMQKLARQGWVYQIVRDLFYTPAAVVELAGIIMRLGQTAEGAKAASFRDCTGIGRKRCIQILEFFDRVGFTRRVGDSHRLRNPEMFGTNDLHKPG